MTAAAARQPPAPGSPAADPPSGGREAWGPLPVAGLVLAAAAAGFWAGLIAFAPLLEWLLTPLSRASWVGFATIGAACATGVVLAGGLAAPRHLRPAAALLLYAAGAWAAFALAPALNSTLYYTLVQIVPAYLAGAVALWAVSAVGLGRARAAVVALLACAAALATGAAALWRQPDFGWAAYIHMGEVAVPVRQFVVEPAPDLPPPSSAYERGPRLVFVPPAHAAPVARAVRSQRARLETDVGSGGSDGSLRPVSLTEGRRARLADVLAASWRANLVREAAEGHVPRALARAPLPAVRLDGWAVYGYSPR